jgi:hypothetical protein
MKKPKGKSGHDATSEYWKTRSDQELLETAFTTDDPESLQGLVQDVPGSDDVMVELAYDFRRSKRPFIRCAHCT